MNDRNLGRLERVDLRDVWAKEDRDFTPWLARPENLEVLADTLGLELEPKPWRRRRTSARSAPTFSVGKPDPETGC